MKRASQQGIALITTLLLLSVITFMAVAFLVLSRSQRGAVTVIADQTTARLAAEAALERAKADLLAPILAQTNPFASDLRVSTNFINPAGYPVGGLPPRLPDPRNPADLLYLTNVAYTYPNGAPLSRDDYLQNLANLYFDPRPPVFVPTNAAGFSDFRFFINLNRNTNGLGWPLFEPTGNLIETNADGLPVTDLAGRFVTNYNLVGDAQWIGSLARPTEPHSGENYFLSRHAYVTLPAGKSLDLNSGHNQAGADDPTDRNNVRYGTPDAYLRNQGVGTWELNFAAFLADLNTNIWGRGFTTYEYNRWKTTGNYNRGLAFDDAMSLLRYRYNQDYGSLRPIANSFPWGAAAFAGDGVDGYTHKPMALTSVSVAKDLDNPTWPWPGADNTNFFFTLSDLYDRNKTGLQVPAAVDSFADRLRYVSSSNSTYDRYTFSRLAAQLGTDTGTGPSGKINLNYDNLVNGYPLASGGVSVSATNFLPWEPTNFFKVTADRLLKASGFNFDTANIPIWPASSNRYTASVHRLLQLAANIYDATTNRTDTAYPHLPTVFKPLFTVRGAGEVYITGYREVTTDAEAALAAPLRDLRVATNLTLLSVDDNVYGIPWVIGTKKGLPNFNEYAMQSEVYVSRMLQLVKDSPVGFVKYTNEWFFLAVSNLFAVEAWNPYYTPLNRSMQLRVRVDMDLWMTNDSGMVLYARNLTTNRFATTNLWRGYPQEDAADSQKRASFLIPVSGTNIYLPLVRALATTPWFSTNLTPPVVRANNWEQPEWHLQVNARLQYALLDESVSPARVVDYVSLAGLSQQIDIPYELQRTDDQAADQKAILQQLWTTNRTALNAPTEGVKYQLAVALGLVEADNNTLWVGYNSRYLDKRRSIDAFRMFYGLPPIYYPSNTYPYTVTNAAQAPFNPTRKFSVRSSWQANDPLVHYTVPDLFSTNVSQAATFANPTIAALEPLTNTIGTINKRYAPWGGSPENLSRGSTNELDYEFALKDPLVWRPDFWDFPTNKFANIGWLGRVHRGTPWQTVYMKAKDVLLKTRSQDPNFGLKQWVTWSGNTDAWFPGTGAQRINTNVWMGGGTLPGPQRVVPDAVIAAPWADRLIFDVFTTALNENAARGQQSVNQDGLAGWSAVLSGVLALTNTSTFDELAAYSVPRYEARAIEPALALGPASPLAYIISAISRERTNTVQVGTNFISLHPNGVFWHLGDVLAVPELTDFSPFLRRAPSGNDPMVNSVWNRALDDAAYERIPQQIMSLLRLGEPRFVIYAYGQALTPAKNSQVLGGTFNGMVTNYTVTAEAALRAVVRIDGLPNKPVAVTESFNLLPPE